MEDTNDQIKGELSTEQGLALTLKLKLSLGHPEILVIVVLFQS